jgi:7,8-dihydroneopterin aldolase/epimerase/oxygenase
VVKNRFKIVELKSKKNKNTIRRTVLIKNFLINEIIGIHKHEKINKQKIIFNIVIDINQDTVPNENSLSSVVDYEQITNKLKNLAKNKNYNFLESLAEDSFKEIFEDRRINSVKIKIEKPDAILNAKSVGVEVFKSRNDYEGS